uniref:Uncharacterized protein n=1 Tax=viral metagenome TaxID=1070528 RepID=A0A6M3LU38_9ZZZZ
MVDPQHLTGPERDEYEARRLNETDLFMDEYGGDKLRCFPLSGRGAKQFEADDHKREIRDD